MRAMMAAILATGALSLLLTGCMTTPPVIVDLQTDKVVVQAGEGDEAAAAAAEKALEGCSLHGRLPHYLSEQQNCSGMQCTAGTYSGISCYPSDCVMHYLFACVK